MKADADVLIVGGGPAGCAALIQCAKLGIDALLIDRSDFPRDKICGDAYSGRALEAIRRLEPNWKEELKVLPSKNTSKGIHFYAPNGKRLSVPFSSDQSKNEFPGFVGRREDLDEWLMNKARSMGRVQTGSGLKSLERKGDTYEATLDSGKCLTSRLVIGADGPYSRIAASFQDQKKDPRDWSYGIRAYYEGVEGLDAEGFIELHFLKDLLPGYFWIFPMPNGKANVGLGLRQDVRDHRKLDLKKELERITTASPLADRFKSAKLLAQPKLHALPMPGRIGQVQTDGILLCGDAAGLVDPFTGEGIGNAMLSGIVAAETVAAALVGQELDLDALGNYEEILKRRFLPELRLSKQLQRLAKFPWLFNFVVNRAESSKSLQETFSCMFTDLDIRARLKDPLFYWKLIIKQ